MYILRYASRIMRLSSNFIHSSFDLIRTAGSVTSTPRPAMFLATLLLPLFLLLTRLVYGEPLFCSASNPNCLGSFFNDSSILNTFLGDHDTVVFQNDVLKNGSDCAAMTLLFARGTVEPGMFSFFCSFDCLLSACWTGRRRKRVGMGVRVEGQEWKPRCS
jgi:hypothetical protein